LEDGDVLEGVHGGAAVVQRVEAGLEVWRGGGRGRREQGEQEKQGINIWEHGHNASIIIAARIIHVASEPQFLR
jgi:hypothetical protein